MDDETFTLVAATQSVKELKGMIRKPANPVSIEEMNAAIEAQGALTQCSVWAPMCWCTKWHKTIPGNLPKLQRR